MKITVFTSNQPRHLNLVRQLSEISDEVFACLECSTLFPGEVEDFYHKSETFQAYFRHVISAERALFKAPSFHPKNVRTLSMKMGDLNRLTMEELAPTLDADHYVVFGASFIKGPLCDFLVERKALNIHMGLSPYYRGNSCNFWALQDGRPEMVGASIIHLAKGLDTGEILFHSVPPAKAYAPFELGMQAVASAQLALVNMIKEKKIRSFAPVAQDKSQELRYTRKNDFTDQVAAAFMAQPPSSNDIFKKLKERRLETFINPVVC